jgi:hypothetical protein
MAKEKKKEIEPICNNCRLYRREKGECGVAVLVDGKKYHLPVFPGDHCHMDELGIEVKEVRFWVEDPKTGKPTEGDGKVKIEYPVGFFGDQRVNDKIYGKLEEYLDL